MLDSPASPSVAVVRAVAEQDGDDPVHLGLPLWDVISPEAIDALLSPARNEPPCEARTVTFRYDGYTVTVDGAAVVTLADASSLG